LNNEKVFKITEDVIEECLKESIEAPKKENKECNSNKNYIALV
jgi:hypothetical protein